MKTLILLLFTVTSAWADCNKVFVDYLNCIAASTGDPTTGKALEVEFDDDFVKHVADCFDAADNNGQNTKCILSRANLDTDVFGPDGPMASCDVCRNYTADLRDKIFKSPESVRLCFREKFSAALGNDLQPCIREQLNDQTFTVPTLPDFDKSSVGFLDTILTDMSHRVMAYSRLSACKERFQSRYDKSSTCMANTAGLYPKHCDLTKTCKSSQVTSDCSASFGNTATATCKCLNIKRDEWNQQLNKIHDAIFNSEKSPTVCSSGVKAALGHWVTDLEDIFKECMPSGTISPGSTISSLSVSKLIEAGCIQAVSATSDETKANQLNAGFRMIRFVLDALNDRVTVFCQANC